MVAGVLNFLGAASETKTRKKASNEIGFTKQSENRFVKESEVQDGRFVTQVVDNNFPEFMFYNLWKSDFGRKYRKTIFGCYYLNLLPLLALYSLDKGDLGGSVNIM